MPVAIASSSRHSGSSNNYTMTWGPLIGLVRLSTRPPMNCAKLRCVSPEAALSARIIPPTMSEKIQIYQRRNDD